MKKFLKKSWHGIPIGIIASVLVGIAVLAAVLITVVQTITQEIVVAPPPVTADEIIAPDIVLPIVYVGQNFSWNAAAPVRATAIEASRTLKAVLAEPTAYSAFSVELTLATKPATSTLVVGTSKITVGTGSLTNSLVLDAAGVYTFTETVTGTAGSAASASVGLTLTIETTP